jgi:hypothetical protein
MKRKGLLEFAEASAAPFLGQYQASFAQSAKNALEISESIGLK